jgi:hypothetical protein
LAFSAFHRETAEPPQEQEAEVIRANQGADIGNCAL